MSALVGLLAVIGAIRVVRLTVRAMRACARAIGDSYRAIVAHARASKTVAPTAAPIDPALIAAVVAALQGLKVPAAPTP